MEAKGICGISISFTAGVAAGAATGAGPGWLSAASLLAASGLLAFLAAGPRRPLPAPLDAFPYFILFSILGFFSYASHPLRYSNPIPFPEPLKAFTSLIDSLPFRDSGTGALVKALLSGDRTDIPRDISSSFRLSGASHILALSGLHLGVIYGIVLKTLSVSGRSRTAQAIRSLLIIGFCSFYTVLTGAGPSTVRALLFIILREIGKLDVSRKASPATIYCGALLIQLVIEPYVITSVGFQLSYLAMCGIILIFPRLKAWYPDSGIAAADKFLPSKWIWNSAALTISCQIFTAPLVWFRFGSFPTYFLLTNLIALPLTEALIICAALCTALYAAGACPGLLIKATDLLAGTLSGALRAIASL